MPTPSTAKWPKPKSEDEFEDIAVDFLRLRWKDPNATRHGRRGQRQNGVDIVGHPRWYAGKTAGAQAKNTQSITLATVIGEAKKALGFPGGLAEFFIVTAADRDAALQAEVREHFRTSPAPFHVEVLFWQDVTADLSADDNLVAKHWKGFVTGSSPPADSPPQWIDRDGANSNETVECQCELRLSIPSPRLDLDAAELSLRVSDMSRAGRTGTLIPVLLQQASKYDADGSTWSFRQRRYANVLNKWELTIGSGGLLALRWAKFTNGQPVLFELLPLLEATRSCFVAYRLALGEAHTQDLIPLPSKVSARIAMHASARPTLHDDIRVTGSASRTHAAEAPPDWTVAVESDWPPSSTLASRLVGRAVANFRATPGPLDSALGASSPITRVEETALAKVMRWPAESFFSRTMQAYLDGSDVLGAEPYDES